MAVRAHHTGRTSASARRALFLSSFIGSLRRSEKPGVIIDQWCAKKYAVQSIQHAAMPRKQMRGILDSGAAFEHRFSQNANLAQYSDRCAEQERVDQSYLRKEDKPAKRSCYYRSSESSNGSL